MRRRDLLAALAAWPIAGGFMARALAAPAADPAGSSPGFADPGKGIDFEAVRPGRPLVFPDDHGAHPGFRSEWWYATGWLARADGSALGFQSTFFRVRSGIGETSPSAFAPRQLLLAHAAIADPRLGRLRHDQRAARVGFGRAGFTPGRSTVWIGDWRFEQQGDTYLAQVASEDFAYALTLTADAPPLANGVDGFSAKAPGTRHASYYYSRPQLAVNGRVTIAGASEQLAGRAWLDHEWSSELLPADARGWDWVAINFADGSALMAFRLRRSDRGGDAGAAPLWSAATLRPAVGRPQTLPPDAVDFAALRNWKSPRTGVSYPVEWHLRVGEHTLHLVPLFDDQELDSRASTGAIYWEGAVRALADGRELGRGYLELTGYAERLRIG